MNGKRLVLIADDARLAQAIRSALSSALGVSPFCCRGEAMHEQLNPLGDAPILVAPGGGEPLLRQIQSLHLQRFAPPIVLLDGPPEAFAEVLHVIQPYLRAALRWPDDSGALVQLVRENTARTSETRRTLLDETIADVIHRRLMACTPSLAPLLECITLAALHDVTVLLTGETGTGKTFIARLMHDCSARRAEPFVAVPCGAQPANLVESVFFGYIKGAFTGADRNKEGKFAASGRGTILLDEIDTLPMDTQAGLLRVIETGDFEPVGSNQTQRCEARIIVASNWNLEEATRQGRFRTDLFYRLNVMSFHLPPLRERVQDVAPLVRTMTARYSARFRKDLFDVRPEALAALESFDWPGNLRQLENVVQQAVLVSKGPELLLEHLPPFIKQGRSTTPINGTSLAESLQTSREQTEKVAIQRALQANNNSRTLAAATLGISRVTLYKKMQKYGLMPRSRGKTAGITQPDDSRSTI